MRARSLLVEYSNGFFLPKALRATLTDDFEPFPIDLLRHGKQRTAGHRDVDFYGETVSLPDGAGDYFLPPMPDDGASAEVECSDGSKIPLDHFLARYERIGILSLHPYNTALIL